LNTLVGCSIYREGEKFCAKYTLDNKQCCQNNNKKDTFSTSHLDDIIISSEPTQSINKMNDNVPNGTTQVCRCFFCVEYLTKLDSTELELWSSWGILTMAAWQYQHNWLWHPTWWHISCCLFKLLFSRTNPKASQRDCMDWQHGELYFHTHFFVKFTNFPCLTHRLNAFMKRLTCTNVVRIAGHSLQSMYVRKHTFRKHFVRQNGKKSQWGRQ
jgi:hypothetical protein